MGHHCGLLAQLDRVMSVRNIHLSTVKSKCDAWCSKCMFCLNIASCLFPRLGNS